MKNVQTIGQRIADARRNRMLTQDQLAKRIAVEENTISTYERDKRVPSVDVIVTLSRVLHVSTDYLLRGQKGQSIDVSDLSENEYLALTEIINALKKKEKNG